MHINKDFNHSYWENKHLFKKYDMVIVGSGIVGLSTAISIKQKHKKAKILVLEKGLQPDGASTKNAGFACFGSVGEILDDLNSMDEDTVWQTIEMRYKGLRLLRNRLKDKQLDYQSLGGYEIFNIASDFEYCTEKIDDLNKHFKQNLALKNCFKNLTKNQFHSKTIVGTIYNQYEGQLDPGLMMENLTLLALQLGIKLLHNVNVISFTQHYNGVDIETNAGIFQSQKMIIATNGFAHRLVKNIDVKPARSQVLITKPLQNLNIKGTFHFDKGYYYFRNIDNRILLGGGRNLDFKKENTDSFNLNPKIQNHLQHILKTVILPKKSFEIEKQWTGIMGIGKEKKPIIQHYSKDVIVAVRMGGMGIAIGTWVGEKVSKLI